MDFSPAQSGNYTPPVDKIVARMVQARTENQARFRPYTVTRDYKLFGSEEKQPRSRVIAEVSFTPPASKHYSIRGSSGSGMGEGIVRRMLASEAEVSDNERSDLTTDNYVFRLSGEENLNGGRCFILEVSPKRNEKNLVKGKIWIDSQTYLLRRVEGEPAKKPSWWIKDIHIKLFYNDVEGMWLQTGLQATASIRIIGPCRMVSQDMEYSIGDMASNQSRRRRIIPAGANAMFSD